MPVREPSRKRMGLSAFSRRIRSRVKAALPSRSMPRLRLRRLPFTSIRRVDSFRAVVSLFSRKNRAEASLHLLSS